MSDLQKPNFETISLLLLMQELTKLSKNKILPFSKATPENNDDHIFYDDKTIVEDGEEYKKYPIIGNSLVDELHHDVISYHYEYNPEIEFVVIIDENSTAPYVSIKDLETDICFTIHDGLCYEV